MGVAIEKADVADLQQALAGTTEADGTRVLTHLLDASPRHLEAFEAAQAGITLQPGTGLGAGLRRSSDAVRQGSCAGPGAGR